MYKEEVIVRSKSGLHARPASQLVKLASSYDSKVMIQYKDKTINAKSLILLLSAGIKPNEAITISAEGKDEKQAVVALVHLINSSE